jgi:hypothetical protein
MLTPQPEAGENKKPNMPKRQVRLFDFIVNCVQKATG